TSHARLRRRFRERCTAEFDNLDVSETTHVQVLAQKFNDDLCRKIRHEPEIKTRHRGAGQDRFRTGFGMAGVNTADRAGCTEDMFLDERLSLHRADPTADPKLPLESDFIELDCF